MVLVSLSPQAGRGRRSAVVVFLDPQRAGDVGVKLARPDRHSRAPARRLPEGAQRRSRIALGGCAIGRLRGFVEACRRFARGVRGGKIAPPLARIVGRRLQARWRRSVLLLPPHLRGRIGEGGILPRRIESRLRTDAGRSSADAGIEQFGERRFDRRQVRSRRFRARRLRRVFLRFCRSGRRLRHRREYGDSDAAWKDHHRRRTTMATTSDPDRGACAGSPSCRLQPVKRPEIISLDCDLFHRALGCPRAS